MSKLAFATAVVSSGDPATVVALNVVIEMELVRMRTQPDGIDLLVPLVAEPGFDHVLGENIAAQQKGVIGFERIKRLLQRAGGGLHLLRLRGRQVIEVLVNFWRGLWPRLGASFVPVFQVPSFE